MAAAIQRRFADVQPSLSPQTLSVLGTLGFESMTPVQAATLPLFLGNKDVCVEACTGSGKTIAYVIPCVEKLQQSPNTLEVHQVGALILSPTRELARQIHAVVELFCAATTLKSILLVGGTDVQADIAKCMTSGCNIVVATPGRVLDVLRRCETGAAGAVPDIKRLEVLVLDEADTLLDMGFHDALTEILGRLPKQRRTGLFSATQTQEVRALARAGLRNPAVVSVQVKGVGAAASHTEAGAAGGASAGAAPSHGVQSTPLGLTNWYRTCADSTAKLGALVDFMQARAKGGHKAIVFLLTCASVDHMAKVLSLPEVRQAAGLPDSASFPIMPLHGKQDPKKRQGVYSKFLAADSAVLLCTDVAARGIDIPDVDWILQYDPPQNPSFYVHRVGRTARAGRTGAALLLLLPKEMAYTQLLGVRNVPLQELAPVSPAVDGAALVPVLQQACVGDRAILEAATRAFVSFIRGYKEHDCKYIFRLDQLDIAALASSFGLVKLPKVKELRGGKDYGFVGLPGVDTYSIAYADPTREAQRQARLAAEADEAAAERAARDARRETAMKAQAAAAADPAGKVAKPKKKRKHNSVSKTMAAEWAILQAEEALEKRLKSGRISKAEYKAQLAALNASQGIAAEDDDLVGMVSEDEDEEEEEGDGADGSSRKQAHVKTQPKKIARK